MKIIAPTARISPLADIEDSVRGSRIVIGEHTVVDAFVKVKPAGGIGDLVIGDHVVINSGVVIYTGNGVAIGANTAIAANCTISATTHQYLAKEMLIREQGFVQPSEFFGGTAGIVIEDDVWIGANCVLLEGAYIRRGAVIGAGSLVKTAVEEYAICSGNPLVRHGFRR